MTELLDQTQFALSLLFTFDPALWEIIWISFSVSTRAILFATPCALLIAALLLFFRFPGRRFIVMMFQSLMAVPAVVIGLTVYIVFSNQGPLGDWRLLFTQSAMVIGQFLLALPILVAMGFAALQSADKRVWETAITLGAPAIKAFWTLMYEVRFALLAALIAAYARIIAEIGCSLMVGGNILHVTRNIPTAIALETSKGEFAQGIALGIVLLTLAIGLNLTLNLIQGKGVFKE